MKKEFTNFCQSAWYNDLEKARFIDNILSILSQKSRRGEKSGKSGINVWGELYALNVPYGNSGGVIKGRDIIKSLRAWLIKKQDDRCCYCRRYLLNNAWAKPIEHILPLAFYPHHSLTLRNLAVACVNCNLAKKQALWWPHVKSGPIYPARHIISGAFHYQFHSYNEHVRWFRYSSNDFSFSLYKGISKEGQHLHANLLSSQEKKEILCCRNDEFSNTFNNVYRMRISDKSLPDLDEFIKKLEDVLLEK